MKKEEMNLEPMGNLMQEFEETQKLVVEETGVPYATWTIGCTHFFTLICC